MKYLLSELLLQEDAEKFMREHEGCEFVNEYPLDAYVREAVETVCRKFLEIGISLDRGPLYGSITQDIIDDIDAIVCYPENAEEYAVWDKKIVTVEHSEE